MYISYVTSIFLILSIFLAEETKANSFLMEKHIINHRNLTNNNLKTLNTNAGFQEYGKFDSNLPLNRTYNEVRRSRTKKKRQAKASKHAKRSHFNKSLNIPTKLKNNLHTSEDKEVKIYETFEEIHEHINEPDNQDGQYQAAKRYESREEAVGGPENIEEEKHDDPVKIKIKHHHHHHHHNHIKEVIRSVPKPYPVEKIVHIPIEKIIEKVVQVPKIVNVTVEKIVHVPVEKVIERIVRVPRPVHISKPYVVEKIMEKIVHVPKPYPVLKTVPYPVEIKVPITVEKKIPVPFTVEVERKVPVYIKSQEPYRYEHAYYKNHEEHGMPKISSDTEETFDRPVYSSENYYHNKQIASKHADLSMRSQYQTFKEPINQHTNIEPIPSKQTDLSQYQTFREPLNQPTNIDPIPSKQTDLSQYQTFKEPINQHTSREDSKTFASMEQSTAESTFIPFKFLETKSPFNIIVANNDTSFNFNPQAFGNKLHELPISFPIEFIQVQPMPFQNHLTLESSNQQPSFKGNLQK
ncbi:uncharacterized protein [Drosophila virilis]|uniref:Uncharacterized protein n=1 Tax=Drosophila virilis TaxID=7244 RepID=B4LR06_DROVI|nr:uncharacterized protein LOC6629123 isoform X1 [Drosophila virilis]EDW64545.2 uncharacterized protein Dvir_GJ21939 [Drosophila virilis]